MSYTPNKKLPQDGFFRLKTPLQCSEGVFEANSIVRISAIKFDEVSHKAYYSIYSLNDENIISDKFCFSFSKEISEWNDTFAPIKGSLYYEKMRVLENKKQSAVKVRDLLQTIGTILFPIAGMVAVTIIICYLESRNGHQVQQAPPLIAVAISIAALIGIFASFITLEYCFTKKIRNAVDNEKSYELDYFRTLEKEERVRCCD